MNYEQEAAKTRAQIAREALSAALPKDYFGNIGIHEAYRQGLDDMVAWIDLEHEASPSIHTDASPQKDELFDEAVRIVREAGRVSPSLLQQKLKCTYVKSALLMDQLEAHGIIGPKDGAKPRKVL